MGAAHYQCSVEHLLITCLSRPFDAALERLLQGPPSVGPGRPGGLGAAPLQSQVPKGGLCPCCPRLSQRGAPDQRPSPASACPPSALAEALPGLCKGQPPNPLYSPHPPPTPLPPRPPSPQGLGLGVLICPGVVWCLAPSPPPLALPTGGEDRAGGTWHSAACTSRLEGSLCPKPGH